MLVSRLKWLEALSPRLTEDPNVGNLPNPVFELLPAQCLVSQQLL